jgi:hypothetical protein
LAVAVMVTVYLLYFLLLNHCQMIQKLLSTVLKRVIIVVLGLIILSCRKDQENHEKMVSILAEIQQSNFNKTNPFCPEAEIAFYASSNGLDQNIRRSNVAKHQLAMAYLKAGEEQKAVEILEKLIPKATGQFPTEGNFMRGSLAIANMRLGERQNCVRNHTSESCVIPIVNTGVHTIQTGRGGPSKSTRKF